MEPLRTLNYHRKSANHYRFIFGRQTISVTRRFLPSRAVRVRVTSSTISGRGDGNWSECRDFTDMHEGDAAYSKQVNAWCAKWEKRSYSSQTQKETHMNEPTREPTQDVDTDPQSTASQRKGAAELAVRRTGAQHVVGEDGHILCRVPADTPVALNARGRAAVEGEVVGRVLGEYTVRRTGNRLGRSDAMLMLLKATTNHLREADMATRALRSGVAATAQAVEHAKDAQAKAKHFRGLRNAGYAADTTWDELIDMLRPIVSAALHELGDRRVALGRGGKEGRVPIQRDIDAAKAFLDACRPILGFFREGSPDGQGA